MAETDLTSEFEHLLHVYQLERAEAAKKSTEPMIQVNEVIGYLAFIYDKTRNVVEFGEDHVLRKNTVKRILKRKLLESDDPYDIAGGLIRELVRNRHLENNSVPESRIQDVGAVVMRYQAARRLLSQQLGPESARELRRFLLHVTTTEIDDILVSKEVDYAFINTGYNIINPIIQVTDKVDQDFKNVQVFIAMLQSLMRLDDEMLKYHLMGVLYPKWFQYGTDLPDNFIGEINEVKNTIDAHLEYELRRKIISNVDKYSAYFTMLRDAMETDPEQFMDLVQNPMPGQANPFEKRKESLDDYLQKVVGNRYDLVKKRLLTRAIRAFIYVLATKLIVSLVIEVPADLFLEGEINYFTLLSNIIVPLVLILLMAFTVRVPGSDNTARLIEGMKDLIYQEMDSQAFAEEKVVRVRKDGIMSGVFLFLYFALSAAIYGFIIYGLWRFDFNIISGGIFLLIVSIISYFGIIMRKPARQLKVIKQRENVFTFLMQLLSLPVLRFGRFVSENFSKINVFVYILDFLIEAPFQVIIEVFEDWTDYLRGKREEIY